MRFIRREQIITTIFNKDLSPKEDADTIRIVFNNLYDHRIEFSVTVKKLMEHNWEYTKLSFEKARVLKVYEDDTVDLLMLKKGTKLSWPKVAFSDIVEVNATTKKHKVLDVDTDITRWDLLDL